MSLLVSPSAMQASSCRHSSARPWRAAKLPSGCCRRRFSSAQPRATADASSTLEHAASPHSSAPSLEAVQTQLESALEAYKYISAPVAEAEGPTAASQRRLDAIGRELNAASREEYARLSGATHTAASSRATGSLLSSISSSAVALPALEREQVVQKIEKSILPFKLKPLERRGESRPEGTGREVLLQGFNWDSWKQTGGYYNHMAAKAEEIAALGVSAVWLPPFAESVSPQGYLPGDLYNLNSRYGSEAELRACIKALQGAGLKVLGDAVLNHRCAQRQDEHGVWNLYGGRLAWDQRAIVGDDHTYRGRGNHSSGESFAAAPNIDHSQEFVKRDLCEWLVWLRSEVGFDGWRLDFVKGFHGSHVRDYMEASQPGFAVGEYWTSLDYEWDGTPKLNQDAHRQRTIDWIHAAGGLCTAFDITTKGILHAVFERCEYWRLRDDKGKPPGLLGWWASRAVTFISNHDTDSTQGHWRFPHHALEQGYAYILTHPGTPTVFYDHVFHDQHLSHTVARLIAQRKAAGIHCRSAVKILAAERDVYAAEVTGEDGSLLVRIGPGDWKPREEGWKVVECGHAWCLWAKQ